LSRRTACGECSWPAFALRLVLALVALAACVGAAAQTDAGGRRASEEAVKAAYIYRFLNYVSWPADAFADAGTAYVIGVAGNSEVADELSRIAAAHRVGNRPITVRRIRPGDATAGLHVLFIAREAKYDQADWIRQLKGRPVLVITETEDALREGSMINFRVVDQRVRFEVDLGTANRAGLKIDSRMLEVALSVVKEASQ